MSQVSFRSVSLIRFFLGDRENEPIASKSARKSARASFNAYKSVDSEEPSRKGK